MSCIGSVRKTQGNFQDADCQRGCQTEFKKLQVQIKETYIREQVKNVEKIQGIPIPPPQIFTFLFV